MQIPNQLKIYVDGSFNKKEKAYGSALVVVRGKEVIYTYNERGTNPEYLSLQNVTGELFAAVRGIQCALANGYYSVLIYYDFEGIEKWANGGWKRNKPLTKAYAEEISKYRALGMQIKFKKVKSHSGDKFNNLADKLAKEAISKK